MKTLLNITALKKYCKNSQVNYYNCADDKIIMWHDGGHFAIMLNKIIFTEEILNHLPTFEQDEIPTCIKKMFVDFWDDIATLSPTPIAYTMPDGKSTLLYKNKTHNYIVPINAGIVTIFNNIEDYTMYQNSAKTPVLMSNALIKAVICPMWHPRMMDEIRDIVAI